MLSIEDFQCLNFDEKCDLVTFSANYLLHRDEGPYRIYLYFIHNFFVEVYFTLNGDNLHQVKALTDNSSLWNYVEAIELDDLFV